jgi:S1-C subfamily serine protease
MTLRRRVDLEIAGLTVELARQQILRQHLRGRLAEGSPEAPRTAQERRELETMLATQAQEIARLQRQLSARCGGDEPVKGYLGVFIVAKDSAVGRGAQTSWVTTYPVVVGVEPGSPAARAGLAKDDTITAINRMDMRGRALDQFVRQPGGRVTLTVGGPRGRRDITVTVAPKPSGFGGACVQYRDVLYSDSTGRSVVRLTTPGSGVRAGTMAPGGRPVLIDSVRVMGREPISIQLTPDSAAQGSAFVILAPTAAGSVPYLARGPMGAIVAGAEVALINGGLKTVFAVDYGALVVNVAPRSPAEHAGILSGDVIVKVQGESVTAIPVLQRAIAAAHDQRAVTLDIVRAKMPKTITLRW